MNSLMQTATNWSCNATAFATLYEALYFNNFWSNIIIHLYLVREDILFSFLYTESSENRWLSIFGAVRCSNPFQMLENHMYASKVELDT